MTSPVAVWGLTWTDSGGALDLQDWPDFFFDEMPVGGPGELADIRGTDWVVPSLSGQQRGVWRPDTRAISVVGQISGSGADEAARRGDAWDNRILLGTRLNPDEQGTLTISLPNGDDYSITARPLVVLYTEVDPTLWKPVTIEFRSIAPDWSAV